MIVGLDHVVVLVGDIEAGVAAYQTLFACAPSLTSRAMGSQASVSEPATSLQCIAGSIG